MAQYELPIVYAATVAAIHIGAAETAGFAFANVPCSRRNWDDRRQPNAHFPAGLARTSGNGVRLREWGEMKWYRARSVPNLAPPFRRQGERMEQENNMAPPAVGNPLRPMAGRSEQIPNLSGQNKR